MARRPQLLSEKISALFDAFESAPIPTTERVKNGLWEFVNDAQALEDGQRATEAKSEIAALEKKTQELDAINKKQAQEFKSDLGQLEAMLEKANAEVTRLRDEKEKHPQQRSEAEERILSYLTNGRHATSRRIANSAGIGLDMTEIYLHGLSDAGLVKHFFQLTDESAEEFVGVPWWMLTLDGRKYLAGRSLIK